MQDALGPWESMPAPLWGTFCGHLEGEWIGQYGAYTPWEGVWAAVSWSQLWGRGGSGTTWGHDGMWGPPKGHLARTWHTPGGRLEGTWRPSGEGGIAGRVAFWPLDHPPAHLHHQHTSPQSTHSHTTPNACPQVMRSLCGWMRLASTSHTSTRAAWRWGRRGWRLRGGRGGGLHTVSKGACIRSAAGHRLLRPYLPCLPCVPPLSVPYSPPATPERWVRPSSMHTAPFPSTHRPYNSNIYMFLSIPFFKRTPICARGLPPQRGRHPHPAHRPRSRRPPFTHRPFHPNTNRTH